MKYFIFVIIFFSLGCYNLLRDYYFDNLDISRNLPESIIDTSKYYYLKIERDIKFKEKKELIEKAESCYPPAKEVLKMHGNKIKTDIITKNIWWFREACGIKLPYALTNLSIQYYLDIFNKYKKEANNFKKDKSPSPYLSLKYTANVDYYPSVIYNSKEYFKVYVVELNLKWSGVSGGWSALSFSKKRLVIFSKENLKLLGIIGDGYTRYGIS